MPFASNIAANQTVLPNTLTLLFKVHEQETCPYPPS